MSDTIQSVNPATGAPLERYRLFTPDEADAAVERAHAAFLSYRSTTFAQRAAWLGRVADLLAERKDAYAKIITSEMGKAIRQAKGELDICIAICRYYQANAERLLAPQPVANVWGAQEAEVRKDPIGIVFGVMPWNYPFYQVIRYVAPNLMAGNTLLLKHASNVPGCAKALEDVVRDAGFPEGTFINLVIPASGVARIIENPKVRGVTLTGSEPAGRKVGAQAGQHIKPVVLELGGSDPFVVLDDADVGLAVKLAVEGRFANAGQACTSAKRLIVDQKVAPAFIEGLTKAVQSIEPGDPMQESTFMGPLARSDLRDELHDQVTRAQQAGAKLVVGGKAIPGPGSFYAATLLVDVDENNPAFQEELFGPVAVVTVAKDEADALRLANNSRFGLGSAVITKDIERGKRFAVQVEAGMCYVNRPTQSPPELPFGGVKDSGIGRELGESGISEFLNVRTVYVGKPPKPKA
ncbi:MAG: NAD-dependent succinate-semialdehyde dehydrogenase [Polyangiales bacterium]